MNEKPAIAEIVELLSKKWMIRIIWELRDTPLTFRQLQEACDCVSPTVLNQRLKTLRQTHLVEKQPPEGYSLTPMGRELLEIYGPLKAWAEAWQGARGKKK